MPVSGLSLAIAFAQATPDAGTGGMLPHVLLLGGGFLGALLRFAGIAFHVVCIVHLIRHRQDFWWIFLILGVPPIGSIAYFVVVMWPEIQQRRRRQGGAKPGTTNTKRRIREMEEAVALVDTVENQADLAAAYCDDGQYALARERYTGCLKGLYKDDPNLLFGLAKACHGDGDFSKALEILGRIAADDVPEYANERGLLKAHSLAALGQDEEAIAVFRKVAPKASSMEAWWRLATLLVKTGDEDGADAVCRRMIEAGARMSPVFRRRQKQWLEHATQRLKSR